MGSAQKAVVVSGGVLCYVLMVDDLSKLPPAEVEAARKRRLAAMRLQEIEGNPLSPADIALFEMFEREAWTHERRRAYLLTLTAPLAAE